MAQTQAATLIVESPNVGASTMDTPAVSARILKKRETDRRCQRMIRERTKSRIAYLEGLVEQFRQQDSSGRVETLMKQLSDMKEDRDSLAKKVKSIESIISDSKLKEEPDTQPLATSSIPATSEEPEPTSALTIDTNQAYTFRQTTPNDLPSTVSPRDIPPVYHIHNKEYAAYMESSSRSSWAASTIHPGQHQSCDCSTNTSALDPSLPLNKWRYANDTLTEWFKWSPEALAMQDYILYNDDIPVRAIVEGWDAVEKRGHMHPAWRLLRGIDQTIFHSCGQRERLAILQTMGLLLQAHLNPTKEQHSKLPSFYLKRPSQDMLHSYATEYFAWPGLRERFVFSEHRYCSNIFWRLFCKSLRVQWPYEFRDCFVRNTETGLYRISPTFHERISDIRHWTMGMDMFKQYPELYNDIPAYNHIPSSISPVSRISKPFLRAPPSSSSTSESRDSTTSHEKNAGNYSQPSDLMQSRQPSPVQRQLQQPPPPQNVVPHYYPTSTGTTGTYNLGVMVSYDYAQPVIMESMPELQQPPTVNNWGYNSSLDMYQVHPA
ncbi:hypothetical protein H2198_008653 [Neophaeococcomyces mojaviensis]|uniref:Uncharacterized protein n=1 Tax=Neophaeococcomyces mojaviensis TaxID=3383035 RepID=A0ACC2ZWS3_9EURO|nr:hypothetical protein H2198_008653 [Knufia sp. JES_112]